MLARITRQLRNLSTHVTYIPGDGIGPEVMRATQELVAATGAPILWDVHHLSEIQGYTKEEYDSCVENIQKNKICMKGFQLAGQRYDKDRERNLNMQMKYDLDVFASIVACKSMVGINTIYKNLDFIIIRETTEGEYTGIEHTCKEGVVEHLKVMSYEKCYQVNKFAFDYALKFKRKRITCVHKANIMKMSDGLFLKTFREVSKLYPSIEIDDMIIDNTCMQMVSNPHQFDVIVTGNLYGNILSNLGAGLVGGVGVLPGACTSPELAFFEAGGRYTFQSAAGKDICNPTAMFLAAGNMLYHAGLDKHGQCIKNAVRKVIKRGKVRTRDLGGYHTTTDFTAEVINNLSPVQHIVSRNEPAHRGTILC